MAMRALVLGSLLALTAGCGSSGSGGSVESCTGAAQCDDGLDCTLDD
jgi:hypothetical protein